MFIAVINELLLFTSIVSIGPTNVFGLKKAYHLLMD